MARVGVCIPTAGRPAALERVLESLAGQRRAPDAIVVVDASSDDACAQVCARMGDCFAPGVLVRQGAEPSLPAQRVAGIEALERSGTDVVCMLDDDVTLDPRFLERSVGFLESPEGERYGGLSGYDEAGWGVGFDRVERLYARIGLYDGPLAPGRWLYCGRFLELSRLAPFDGVRPVGFVPGGHTVWRMEVFAAFRPPLSLRGYALLEDKHLSLRVATRYALGVVGGARVRHDRAPGGRPPGPVLAFTEVRRRARLLRDCDPSPRAARYAAFLAVELVDVAVKLAVRLVRLRVRLLPAVLGSLAGWVSCVLAPPRRSADALPRD